MPLLFVSMLVVELAKVIVLAGLALMPLIIIFPPVPDVPLASILAVTLVVVIADNVASAELSA